MNKTYICNVLFWSRLCPPYNLIHTGMAYFTAVPKADEFSFDVDFVHFLRYEHFKHTPFRVLTINNWWVCCRSYYDQAHKNGDGKYFKNERAEKDGCPRSMLKDLINDITNGCRMFERWFCTERGKTERRLCSRKITMGLQRIKGHKDMCQEEHDKD